MNKIATGEASMIALRGSSKDFSPVRRAGQAEASFIKAQHILRQETALTIEQFEELDELFRKVSRLQFGVLVDDPCHQRQLRSYEILSWRRGMPLLVILVALLLFGVAAGTIGLKLGDRAMMATDAATSVPSADTATGP
jgi:hypothetical protein